jgi:apolipoprotein N-acyltransferase
VVGAYGLSVLALCLFSAPAAFSGPGSRLSRSVPLIIGLVLIAASGVSVQIRLSQAQTLVESDYQLQLVSLNLPQEEKRYARVMTFWISIWRCLTGPDRCGCVIWPEGAMPAMLLESPDLLAEIRTPYLRDAVDHRHGPRRSGPERSSARIF